MARTRIVGVVLFAALSTGTAVSAQSAGAEADNHWAMVNKYCTDCHNSSDWAGGLALDTVEHDESAIPANAETWEKVIRRLRGRLMPPPGENRPATRDLDAFVGWMESKIDSAAQGKTTPGYVPLHRLNRREYANSIRYLLDLDLDPTSLLPQDDLSDGFDNVAKVLQVSPTFLDQYLAAARTVAVQAVGRLIRIPSVVRSIFMWRDCHWARAVGSRWNICFQPMVSTNSTSTTWRMRCGWRAWSLRTQSSHCSTA
jgi:Protein of unknown function (DUF1587)/Planctomycete cytochrome C